MNNKILLVGGAEYIGSHTYVALIEASFDVVILDDFGWFFQLWTKRFTTLRSDHRPKPGNLLRRLYFGSRFVGQSIFRAQFCGGNTFCGTQGRKRKYWATYRIFWYEYLGFINTAASNEGSGGNAVGILFSSFATVYGAADVMPVAETAPLQYTSPYAFTKVVSEQILEQAAAAEP